MARIALFILLSAISYTSFAQRIGLTRGPLPFLEYGLGEDRLGGAKMVYLDSMIQLVVVDSAKGKYKVQLSKNHSAYIPKDLIRLDTFVAARPYFLSGNARSWGDSLYDYVQLNLDARLPYKITQINYPTELVVDIFGATTNTNWLVQTSLAQTVRQLWYEQPEDDLLRFHIGLNTRHHWGAKLYYEGNRLIIRLPRPPAKPNLQGLTIAVDAGHGGANSGAQGVLFKRLEKEYTLEIAMRLQNELLRRGANVFMTRVNDSDITMVQRAVALRAVQPNLLISVHHNSTGRDTVTGVGCYYRYPGFAWLNGYVLDEIVRQTNMFKWGLVGNFNFALSGPIEYPNCLVELGYLSNPNDERRIADSNFQKVTVKAIADGIEKYLESSLLPDKPTIIQQTIVQPPPPPIAAPIEETKKSRRQKRREAAASGQL